MLVIWVREVMLVIWVREVANAGNPGKLGKGGNSLVLRPSARHATRERRLALPNMENLRR